MTAAAWVALALFIGWLVGLQTLLAGHDHHERLPRHARLTTTLLATVAALLVVPRFHEEQPHPGQDPDLTLVVLLALTGWLVGLQARGVGRDRRAPASEAERLTTALLAGAAALLALPRLYLVVT